MVVVGRWGLEDDDRGGMARLAGEEIRVEARSIYIIFVDLSCWDIPFENMEKLQVIARRATKSNS